MVHQCGHTAHPHPSNIEMEAAFISLKSVTILVHSLNRFRFNTPVRTRLSPKSTSVNRPAELCVPVEYTSNSERWVSNRQFLKICQVNNTCYRAKVRDMEHSGVGQ